MCRLAFLLVLVSVATFGCDTTAPVVRENVPYRVLLQSGRFFEEHSSSPEGTEGVPPISVALSSEAAEAEFLEAYPRNPHWLDGEGPLFEPFPSVDYTRETAVVVALGSTGSGGVLVRVDSVITDDRRVVVHSTRTVPCVSTRNVTNPAVIVALEGRGHSVSFEEVGVDREACP